MGTALRILIVVALQTAALAYMIVDRQATLNAARIVTLKVAPVDPRDIFRGDYVILSYAISNLDLTKLQGDNTFTYGDKVYVTLVPEGDTWSAAAVARAKPYPIQGGVIIAGTVNSFQTLEEPRPPSINPDGSPAPQPAMGSISVTYGIESYFVPEGTGRDIETERQKGDLSADIAIDDTGRPAIKALRRNGQVFYVEGIL